MSHLRLVKTDTGPSLDILRGYKWLYIATPYSSYPGELDDAAHAVSATILKLKAQKLFNLYSPIAHWHEAAIIGDMPTDHEAWKEENGHKLAACDALLVIELTGWHMSEGVRWEIRTMKNQRKPVYYLNPETLGVRQ